MNPFGRYSGPSKRCSAWPPHVIERDCAGARSAVWFASRRRYERGAIWGVDEKRHRQSFEDNPTNAGRALKESNEMRWLRYSINASPSNGCFRPEAGLPPDEESMRRWTAQIERADALLFSRVTYEMTLNGKPKRDRSSSFAQVIVTSTSTSSNMCGGTRSARRLPLIFW